MRDEATFRVKAGLAEMLKGGVIMDVVDAEQAKIAEDAGASAVMALERVPADIRRDGGVARMSDPLMIKGIQETVTIPVMAKARIGHFAEAQVLQALEVDYIDESEVLTPADEAHHIDKWAFSIPFVCGATNLGEALRRIGEGAAMIRSKGEAGTGDIVEAVRHLRSITGEIRRLGTLDEAELYVAAKQLQSPYDIVREVAREGKLPVPLFCAGGIATPADASLVMQLGASRCSSARASSRATIPRCAPARSSRPRRTSPTPSASPRPPRASAGRWSRSRRASCPTIAAARRPRLVRAVVAAPGGVAGVRPCMRTVPRAAPGQPRPQPPSGYGGRGSRAAGRVRRACEDAARLGAEVREVRTPADLEGLDGLVMPGGESTTMSLGIEREGLAEPLRELVGRGTPVLGTCAGLIMLDREHLGLMDTLAAAQRVRAPAALLRGRRRACRHGWRHPFHAVFIRAPWIAEHGPAVEILAEVDGHPVAARQGPMLVVSFHPELAGDTRLHEAFLDQVRRSRAGDGA